MVALGPDHWTIADDLATAPQVVIHPGQHCTTLDGQSLEEEMHQGVRSWGNSAVGETVMLTGAYLFEGEVSRRLLRALPRFVVLSERELGSPLVALLADEIVKDEPGPGRRARPAARPAPDRGAAGLVRAARGRRRRPWYVGQGDPVVGPALRLMQHHPEHPWTVAELAAAGGVSRAAFARRFTDVVGEPPMTFLTGWRLALAADLLRDPAATLATRRPPGRLLHAVRAEHRLQAGVRREPARPPGAGGRRRSRDCPASARARAQLHDRVSGWCRPPGSAAGRGR